MTDFKSLGLDPALLKTLAAEGYATPTPIQAQAIPPALAGRDILGIAQTGTGKTAAFALPILQRLMNDRKPPMRGAARALVLSPTRELTAQIAESFRVYGRGLGLKTAVAFGGVGHKPQSDAILRGLDVLVATPGRLIDHMENGALKLAMTEIVVLDEADQMLDLGFIHAIRKIVKSLPHKRQSLFFSATMPKAMDEIVGGLLRDPVRVAVTPVAKTADRVVQRVIFIETARKRALLAEVLRGEGFGRTLVFTRTKHGADRVVKHLEADGIAASAIHGNKSQGQREKALAAFRSGAAPILIATDIAARGIDVDGVTHVINFDLPNVPEQYVHRIGRTARAGAEGVAVSFCDNEERAYLRDIEKLTRQQVPAEDRRENKSEPREGRAARPASAYKNPKSQNERFAERRSGRGDGGSRRDGARADGAQRSNAAPTRAPRADGDAAPSRKPWRPETGAVTPQPAPAAQAARRPQPGKTARPEGGRRDGDLSGVGFLNKKGSERAAPPRKSNQGGGARSRAAAR
ncbi:MAG: DEAD/DEAH box helicase [Hyphomicrobiales bacterium]|nr:DEAD/DEAH box helicase [Hyphomicrobiales bacterium]